TTTNTSTPATGGITMARTPAIIIRTLSPMDHATDSFAIVARDDMPTITSCSAFLQHNDANSIPLGTIRAPRRGVLQSDGPKVPQVELEVSLKILTHQQRTAT